jgi:hypothetical protein
VRRLALGVEVGGQEAQEAQEAQEKRKVRGVGNSALPRWLACVRRN